MRDVNQRFAAPLRREFTICRDRHGHWLAVESHGLLGGVFVSRKAAERFALEEAGDDPERVHLALAPRGRGH